MSRTNVQTHENLVNAYPEAQRDDKVQMLTVYTSMSVYEAWTRYKKKIQQLQLPPGNFQSETAIYSRDQLAFHPVLYIIHMLRFWVATQLVLLHQSAHKPPDHRFSVHVSVGLSFPLSSLPQAGFYYQAKHNAAAYDSPHQSRKNIYSGFIVIKSLP